MKVNKLMKKAFVVDKDISLKEAAKIMSSKKIGSLFYVEKKKLRGIVTERDVLKNMGKIKSIKKVMSKKIVSVGSNEDSDVAYSLMKENKVKKLPVVDSGGLVGVITLTDLAAENEGAEEDFFFN